MVRRKGLGTGSGKGYKNILGQDKQVHSMSAKGIKQPTAINNSRLNSMDKVKSEQDIFSEKYEKKFGTKYNSNLPIFVKNKILTESEIKLLKRRMNDKKITRDEVFFVNEEGFRLTEEQNQKGLKWMKNLWKGKSGAERKNNPFGYREENVIENFDYIELIDFYDNVNYTQSQMGMKNYQPYYRVVAKPESDGYSDTFEYYMGYSSNNPNNPIQILG